MYLDKIVAYPMRLPSMRVFWAVIQAMDGHGDIQNGVISRGSISRIDYACDYRVNIQTIMRGLYAVRSREITHVNDDDNEHDEYNWKRGLFNSVRIGGKKKVLRIYDKALEQAGRQIHTDRARIVQQRIQDDLADFYGSNEEDEQDDEFEDEDDEQEDEVVPPARRQAWTRMERSIRQTAKISELWNAHDPLAPYRGHLSELQRHLRDIQDGRCLPFVNVILHHVQSRGRQFRKDRTAICLRRDIDNGLLMAVYKTLGGHQRFWRDHRPFFALIPWQRRYQPSSIYQRQMQRWMEGAHFHPRGSAIAARPYQGMPPAEGWRTDLTTGNAEQAPQHEHDDAAQAA